MASFSTGADISTERKVHDVLSGKAAEQRQFIKGGSLSLQHGDEVKEAKGRYARLSGLLA
jgi:hypothetical protein